MSPEVTVTVAVAKPCAASFAAVRVISWAPSVTVPSAGVAVTPAGVSTRKRTSGPVPPVSDRARTTVLVLSPGATVAAVGPTPIW